MSNRRLFSLIALLAVLSLSLPATAAPRERDGISIPQRVVKLLKKIFVPASLDDKASEMSVPKP